MIIGEITLERMTASRPMSISICVTREIYLQARRALMPLGISVEDSIQFAFMRAAREGNANFLFERIDGYAFERI